MNKKANYLNFKMIGLRIREERERLELTRESFAEILGLSSFYVGQIERADRKMSVETLARIADSLHVSIDYLIGKSEEKPDIKEIDELHNLLEKCSKEELKLFKDMMKLVLPHIKK